MWYNSENTTNLDGDEEFYFEEKNKFIINEVTESDTNKKKIIDYKDLYLFEMRLYSKVEEETESTNFNDNTLLDLDKTNSKEKKLHNFNEFKECVTILINKILTKNENINIFLHFKTYFIPTKSSICSEITNEKLYKECLIDNVIQYYKINTENNNEIKEQLLKYIPDLIKHNKYFNIQNYISISLPQREFIISVFDKLNILKLKSKLENLRNKHNFIECSEEINYTTVFELFSKIEDKNLTCESLKFYIINEKDFYNYFDYNEFVFNLLKIR